MVKFQQTLPFLYHLYMMISEPRGRRLIFFGIYAFLMVAGSSVFFKPPAAIEHLLGGIILIWVFGSFIVLGNLIGLVSVLPGIWWLERAGLVLIVSGIVCYVTTLILLGASILITFIPVVIILICAIRWIDIKDYLLAPREG